MEETEMIRDEDYYDSNIYEIISKKYEKMQKEIYSLRDIALIQKGKYLKKRKNNSEPVKRGRKKKMLKQKLNQFIRNFVLIIY